MPVPYAMDEGEKMADSKDEKIKGLEAELKKCPANPG